MWIEFIKSFERIEGDFTYNRRRISVSKMWTMFVDQTGSDLTLAQAIEEAVEVGLAVPYFTTYYVLVMTDKDGLPLTRGEIDEVVAHTEEHLKRYKEEGERRLDKVSLTRIYNDYLKKKEELGERMMVLRDYSSTVKRRGLVRQRKVNRNIFLETEYKFPEE